MSPNPSRRVSTRTALNSDANQSQDGTPHVDPKGKGTGVSTSKAVNGEPALDLDDESSAEEISSETRRLIHTLSERRRRQNINMGFRNLDSRLPRIGGNYRKSKIEILRNAIAHVSSLKEEIYSLEYEIAHVYRLMQHNPAYRGSYHG